MSSDWWSRRLQGGAAPAVRPSSPSLPPVAPPMRGAVQVPREEAAPQKHHSREVLDPEREENEQVPMGDAIRLWKGSKAMRRETYTCPDCGSDHVFSRSNAMVGGMTPAPYCHACGWNGKFTQADQSNWVGL